METGDGEAQRRLAKTKKAQDACGSLTHCPHGLKVADVFSQYHEKKRKEKSTVIGFIEDKFRNKILVRKLLTRSIRSTCRCTSGIQSGNYAFAPLQPKQIQQIVVTNF